MSLLNGKLRDAQMDELFSAVLALENKEECYSFFEDLCTVAELFALKQRFHVAKMLSDGQIYNDIAKETGASTATISRVNKCLEYGTDGYKLALERLKNND